MIQGDLVTYYRKTELYIHFADYPKAKLKYALERWHHLSSAKWRNICPIRFAASRILPAAFVFVLQAPTLDDSHMGTYASYLFLVVELHAPGTLSSGRER